MINPNCERCNGTGLVTISYGGDGYGGRCAAMADADDQPCPECEEWDADEELGPADLEERLETAFERAAHNQLPSHKS